MAAAAAEPPLPPTARLTHARRAPASRHLGCLDRCPTVLEVQDQGCNAPHESRSAALEGCKVW